MSGRIPEHFIQDLLARVDLVDLIDARVPLKRSGSNYVARCPFHDEKTPSFSVNREKQFYHCFGCGVSGSAIGFLMAYDRLTFLEAVETLADRVGLKVPRTAVASAEDGERQQTLERLYALQERACQFYQAQLDSHPAARRALDYLRRRGVNGEILKQFRLGYAPPGWRNLPDDWPHDLLTAAGLRTSKPGTGAHDWFRDRIVFPIRDRRGRVVGFGGRVLVDGNPKYLNSPETATFKKHKEVYGLFELLNAVRQPDCILVVEGYMDVIALAQHGIPNAVATLGTATSADHVALLFRYTQNLVFCFDGDAAGQRAAWKALEASVAALRDGRTVRFLLLPEGHDPDSLVRAEGPSRFRDRIAKARPFSDFFFERLAQRLDLNSLEGKAALAKSAQPIIEQLPQGVFRELMARRLAELTGHRAVKIGNKPVLREGLTDPRWETPSTLRTFLALLLQNPELIDMIPPGSRQRLKNLKKTGAQVRKIFEVLENAPGITPGGILELFRGKPEEPLVTRLIAWNTEVSKESLSTYFGDTLTRLEQQARSERLEDLIHKATVSGLNPDELEEVRRLTTL
ncbi:DNA primase [Candidatus Methylocalor cossyra]|uniref:DNA primase n=1 Tax=Candidatus Methylocalor cossyra TaxID=3108543 RepID=A0ABM9NL83_9GAMM